MERIKSTDIDVYDFIMQFQKILCQTSNKVVGIYLFGSLTYGGFDRKRSDIDLVVITKTFFKDYELDEIREMHKKLEKVNPYWSKRYEVSYTPVEMLKEKEPPKISRPYYNVIFYDEATYGNEWLINNYLLYNHGITVYGPDFKTLLVENIEIQDIQQCCIKDFFAEWLPKINDDKWLSNSHYQSYLVVNVCRILYTVFNREVANKQISCSWVKNEFAGWVELINEAEAWDYNTTMKKEPEAKEFIEFSRKMLEEWDKKHSRKAL
jgi:predicted nucleotidyltransferase